MKKLLMALVLMPMMALADTETVGDVAWSYEVADGKATVTGANPSSGALTIPSTLGGCPVTSIGDYAFWDCEELISVTIPSSVVSIGEGAFSNCMGLTQVTISEGVTTIGAYAFEFCWELSSITIPSSVTSIGEGAFTDCTKLQSFSVAVDNQNYCSVDGFLCSKDGKTLIAGINGSMVVIPSCVTTIGDYAFYYYRGLESVIIPSSVTSIGRYAFFDAWSTSVTIPSSVTSIGENAFGSLDEYLVIYVDEGDEDRIKGLLEEGGFEFDWWYGRFSLKRGLGPYVENVNGVEWTYFADNGVAQIGADGDENSAIPDDTEGTLLIPQSLGGNLVTSIGDYAFCDCAGLTSVTIPSSVKSIGYRAFYFCSSLTSLVIPEGVTRIGGWAFFACGELASITIPSSVTSIGEWAFDGCGSLKTVYVDAGDADRVKQLLRDCGTDLDFSTLAFIEKMTDGGPYAEVVDGVEWTFVVSGGKAQVGTGLSGGQAVSTSTTGAITVPSMLGGRPVTSIGKWAFGDCEGFASVTIPSSVTSIGDYAFWNCSGLASVTIPSSVTCIGEGAFYGCSGLASVTIPSSVINIGGSAFYGCSRLTSVTIPSSVMSIGERAFIYCEKLGNIVVVADNLNYKSVNDCLLSKDGALLIRGPSKDVAIPPSVTRLACNAFAGCVGLKSVTIPSSVTDIGESAFAVCESLKTIYVDPEDTDRVKQLLGDCNSELDFSTLVFIEKKPDGGPYKEVVDGVEWTYMIKNGEAQVGADPGDSPAIPSDTTGAIVIPSMLGVRPVTRIGANAFLGCSGLTSITMPPSVTSIGRGAFWFCSSLAFVTIPSRVTDIGSFAFEGCSKLTSVMIPLGVTDIRSSAFGGCSGLTTMIIPPGVTSIGANAFSDCSGLVSVTIPSSVTSIEYSAFGVSESLKTVYVDAGDADRVKWLLENSGFEVSGLSFLEKKTDGGPYAETINGVEWKYAIRDGEVVVKRVLNATGAVTIPTMLGGRQVMSIGDHAFEGCTGMTQVALPAGIASIGDSAFRECASLTAITIPSSVTNVGYFAFRDCVSLDQIEMRCPESVAKAKAFDGTPKQSSSGDNVVCLTTTNVAVNYVFNSVQPEFAIPATSDTGFVNIITEVKGNNVAIPATWAEEYPNFVSKYGSDFTKAVTMKSGKRDGAGNEMLVWQDYVAGTNPTDETDVFRASITIVDGKVTISYTPELDDARKAMRKYTTWGKTSLMDTDWTEVQEGHEAEYNFFKVSVEMR